MTPGDRDHLTRTLVLEAGRLMEELSPDLALTLPSAGEARQASIAAMLETARSIEALLATALHLADDDGS